MFLGCAWDALAKPTCSKPLAADPGVITCQISNLQRLFLNEAFSEVLQEEP